MCIEDKQQQNNHKANKQNTNATSSNNSIEDAQQLTVKLQNKPIQHCYGPKKDKL